MSPKPKNIPLKSEEAKPFQLGVLLVHGIGRQRSGETLVHWGDVLLDAIHRGTKRTVSTTGERKSSDEIGDERAATVIQLDAENARERWLLAEGWWAESFPAPSYRQLVSWSVRALPWSIAFHMAQRYWQAAPADARLRQKIVPLLVAILQLVVALALTPVFIVVLAIAVLLGTLPIPQLRASILSAQSALTATVGDSLAFVESPIRATLIRTRILDGLAQLKRQCRRTVIVAHSQGAAAVLDALGGIGEPDYDSESVTWVEPSEPTAMPDTLLTFGAGINQLVGLKVLAAGLPKRIGYNPAWVLMIALLATVALSGWLYWNVQAQVINLTQIRDAALLWLGSIVGSGLLLTTAKRLIDTMANKVAAVQKRKERVQLTLMMILFIGVLVGAIAYAESAGWPLAPIMFLGLVLIMLAVSTWMILSRDMHTLLEQPVRRPPGLQRWVDLYASADPVPNGPTRVRNADDDKDAEKPETVPIWNEGSLLSDHTVYWNNLDGFALRVARVCAETAQSPWIGSLPPATISVDERAKWRVSFFRLSRWITGTAWLILLVVIWLRNGAQIPELGIIQLPFELPAWLSTLSSAAARFTLLATLIGIIAWATSATLRAIWRLWVRSEQNATLNHQQRTGNAWHPLVGMMMVVWFVVSSVILVIRNRDDVDAGQLLSDPSNLFAMLSALLGAAFISTALLLWRHPAPQSTSGEVNG